MSQNSEDPESLLVQAADIYDPFPDNDLLPIDPPGDCTRSEFVRHVEDDCCDTLFIFLVREILGDGVSGALSLAEGIKRVTRARNDLNAVLDHLTNRLGSVRGLKQCGLKQQQ